MNPGTICDCGLEAYGKCHGCRHLCECNANPSKEAHLFDEPVVFVADHGPMEGEWFVEECQRCGVIAISNPFGGIENVIAAFQSMGLAVVER